MVGVRNCPITSLEEASRLILSFCKERRKGSAKVVKTKDQNTCPEDTTRMGVSFDGKVERILCADGGSDIILMPRCALQALLETRAGMKITKYNRDSRFPLAAVDKFVE